MCVTYYPSASPSVKTSFPKGIKVNILIDEDREDWWNDKYKKKIHTEFE